MLDQLRNEPEKDPKDLVDATCEAEHRAGRQPPSRASDAGRRTHGPPAVENSEVEALKSAHSVSVGPAAANANVLIEPRIFISIAAYCDPET